MHISNNQVLNQNSLIKDKHVNNPQITIQQYL